MGKLATAADRLRQGSAAPDFTVPDLDGGTLTLSEFRGKPVLLVFWDPGCGQCDAISPWLAQFNRWAAPVELIMVSIGDFEATRDKVREHGIGCRVGVLTGVELPRRYALIATPIAYAITAQGEIAGDIANGGPAVVALGTWMVGHGGE